MSCEAPDIEIDLSGMRCPLPVLRTKKALGRLAPGQVLRVLTTDDASRQDIPAFVEQAGHRVEHFESAADGGGAGGDHNIFYIRKL